jgi:hypothetical protein
MCENVEWIHLAQARDQRLLLEHDDKPSGSMYLVELLNQRSGYYLLRKDSAAYGYREVCDKVVGRICSRVVLVQ